MQTPGAQVSKSMHPAAKMCTQGTGCTHNFVHRYIMQFQCLRVHPAPGVHILAAGCTYFDTCAKIY